MRGELPSARAVARRLKNWVFEKLGNVDSAYVGVLWYGREKGGGGVEWCTVTGKRLNNVRRWPRGTNGSM